MFYIYVLQSLKDYNFYVGYTNDLRKRKIQHDKGLVASTKSRRPFLLVYYEACLNQQDASHREKYLKSSWGKRYLKARMKNYLTGWTNLELVLNMLAETATTEISEKREPKNLEENKKVARDGGSVAGNARKDIEGKTGKKAITKKNAQQIGIIKPKDSREVK